jgi:hypothetical protein
MSNLMYEDVDENSFLYYQDRTATPPRFYRVPTFGKVYKMIDFGRSVLVGTGLGSNTMTEIWKDYDPDNMNNDLYRFTSIFVESTGLSEYMIALPRATYSSNVTYDTMIKMFRSILSCDNGRSNVFTRMITGCATATNDPSSMERCRDNIFNFSPYGKGSTCTNATPGFNLNWFDKIFGIRRTDIPKGAYTYNIL